MISCEIEKAFLSKEIQTSRAPCLFDGPTKDCGLEIAQIGDELCFNDSTLNLSTILTESTILTRLVADDIARQTTIQAETQRQAAFEQEVMTNDLCTASLAEIESRIDTEVAALQAQLDATTTAAEVKAHLRNQLYPKLGAVFKKIAKCIRARAR